jgi:hypothetical protein
MKPLRIVAAVAVVVTLMCLYRLAHLPGALSVGTKGGGFRTAQPARAPHRVVTRDSTGSRAGTTTRGQETTVVWYPTHCLAGTTLKHKKLVAKCTAQQGQSSPAFGETRDVAPVFCSRLLNAGEQAPERCGQWSRGQFSGDLSLEALAAAADQFRAAEARCLPGDIETGLAHNELAFTGADGRERLEAKSCQLRYASAAQALGVLSEAARTTRADVGQGILFAGDSMTRQLFLRLIALLRGQPPDEPLAEHYFHTDGLYVVLDTGEDAVVPFHDNRADKGDSMVPLDARGEVTANLVMAAHFGGYSGLGGSGKRLSASELARTRRRVVLAMLYTWETKPSAHRSEFVAMKPSVHVAAFMYWWQNKDKLEELDTYTAKVDRHYTALLESDRQASHATLRYVWLSTPWTSPKLFGGVEPAIRAERNNRARRWVGQLSNLGAAHGGALNASYVDFSGIADLKHMPKTTDGIHYMCIWTPKVPLEVDGMKDNGQGCRDPMNAAVAQVLLTHLA